ncbi:MAG: TolC family protein [Saprospiraceae bacterium]|nr:TolC family protein [Saprospiraceae bacterium]
MKTYLFLALILFSTGLRAQDTWSLERCIEYARDNNITIKQALANVRTAALSEQQAKASRLPNVSANADFGEQFGRRIDRVTNQFTNEATGFSSVGLNAGVNLYNGGLINHSIKQAKWDLQAATADAERTINDLGLLIASAYLNILLSEEQLENAQKRVEQSKAQLSATEKLIDAGTVPMADKFNLLAQVARDEQLAVQAQNTVDLGYLTLKQYLQLEPDYQLQIERPEVLIPADATPEKAVLPMLYQTAIGTQPGIRAADFRVKSAQEGIAIARSAYYPSLSLFGNLSSNYSSRAVDVLKGKYIGQETVPFGTFVIGSVVTDVEVVSDVYEYPKMGYFQQIDRNFGQGFGLSLNIPIYQNGRTRLNVERARLGVLTAQMQQTQTQQNLKNDIQTAIANARAAKLQLAAAQKTYDATTIAFQNTEKRHALGAVNALDLTTAKNNRDISENDLVVAKYDYLFKLKILDFYEGKPLKM